MNEQNAINTLRNIMSRNYYQDEKEAINLAIETLEKQIPKKLSSLMLLPNINKTVGLCPNCQQSLYEGTCYCTNCGQKIKAR